MKQPRESKRIKEGPVLQPPKLYVSSVPFAGTIVVHDHFSEPEREREQQWLYLPTRGSVIEDKSLPALHHAFPRLCP